jgi:N-acetylated-alpha-linked acidic dipeptidase
MQHCRLLLLLAGFAAVARTAEGDRLRGFDEAGSQAQQRLEAKLLVVPDPERVKEAIRIMSEEPHHTGSEASMKVAAWALEQFRAMGLQADYHEFEGLMPVPRERSLEVLEPKPYKARLEEPAMIEDKDSSDEGGLPPYNAYSPDGDVTGQVVYVNYGMPDDYARLDELGVSVEGKIVLARYGGGWRGIKPKLAAEKGAIGCLIYSDPRDDGFFQGDAYPTGRYRPEWGVQRGSTMDMPTYPGDPQSPGFAAKPGGRKLPLEEVRTLPKVPVLPISWGDARPILEQLGGPVAPEPWRGAVPVTYHIGPGPAKVRLQLAFDWNRPMGRNVIATIPGSEFPDEWVIYGNHHDAWVNGAVDPVSGAAALLETARSLAEAVKQGWKPKRTILLALWDAEEWGLIGSTEWGEEHAEDLRKKAVVYFNTDSNNEGVLSLAGSHTLERFLNDVARSVPDPRTGRSLWAVMQEDALEGADEQARKAIDSRRDLRIGALGSGSDYTVFIDHLAIASTNTAFRGNNSQGIYHSKYDTFDWYQRFGDPSFLYGKAMAQVHAVAISRMADAVALPFEFTNFADTIRVYLDELKALDPEGKANLARIDPSWRALAEAAAEYETAYEKAASDGFKGDPTKLNAILRGFEQTFGRPEGLPDREWFKHHVYAPGFYTGYGVKTIPGVREALDRQDFELAGEQAGKLAEILDLAARRAREATAEVKKL